MKTWQFALLGGALLAVAGCRTDPRIALVERDNFLKEQEIYRLRAQLEEYQDGDRSCPRRTDRDARSGRDYDREEAPPRRRSDEAPPTASGDRIWTSKSPDSPPKRSPIP